MPKAKPKVVVYPPGTEWVFVDIDVMLGDGDGTIHGFAVLTKEKWEKDADNFKKALAKQKKTQAEVDNVWGLTFIDLSNYEAMPCTSEKMETLREFFPSQEDGFRVKYGDFQLPTEFLE